MPSLPALTRVHVRLFLAANTPKGHGRSQGGIQDGHNFGVHHGAAQQLVVVPSRHHPHTSFRRGQLRDKLVSAK